MDEQWSLVKQTLNDLLEADPDDPTAWLETHCDDPEVRTEVESLRRAYQHGHLSESDEAAGWLPAVNSGPGALPNMPTEPDPGVGRDEEYDPLGLEGEHVDGYLVEELIGSGGMGIVYRAQDPELERRVALKVLPPGLARSSEAEQRFLREARSASSLEHPHIATVYGVGRIENGTAAGQRFIAMAYYEGQTLKEKLEQEGALPIEEAVRYAAQIADALARAHAADIIHRDVKPANVMVTEAGEVKLLDFGLAKAVAETQLTETGRRLGTVAYMSPEQAAGESVGPPTDLWALGSILYEMVGGERAFEGGRDAAILYAIQHEAPAPLHEKRPDTPPALERIVQRCLQKEPEERYASADDLLDDLRAFRMEADATDGPTSSIHSSDDSKFQLGWGVGGAVATALIVGLAVAVGWGIWPGEGEPSGAPSTGGTPDRSVAVLPFEVSGEGAQAWRDGMVTLLSVGLDGAAGLRAVADRTVFAAWEDRETAGRAATADEALAVAREVGAEYAVLGSAVDVGRTLRLSAEVRRAASGEQVGRVQVQGTRDSVTALTNELSRAVLGVLLDQSEEEIPSIDLSRVTTGSLGALKSYLAGERHFRNGQYQAAINDFGTAIERDSTFALAYVRLGISKAWVGERAGIGPALRQAHRRAAQLPRRERQLVQTAYKYNVQDRWKEGVDNLRRLARIYPDDPTIWYYLGETLIYASVPGGLPESERAFEEATRLDPGVAPYRHKLAQLALALHRDSALTAHRIDCLPSGPRKRWYQTVWALNFGSPERRKEAWARIDTVALDAVFTWPTIPMSLFHPTAWEVEDRMLSILSHRADVGPVFQDNWALHKLKGGRLQAAISEAPDVPRVRREMTEHRALGYPVPDSLFCTRALSSQLEPSARLWQLQCVGISLVEKGRAEALSSVLEPIRRLSTRSDAPPGIESQAARTIRSIKGYRAYRAGSLRVAAEHWNGFNFSGDEGAIWRGDLYRELGRPHPAKAWYKAAWSHPLAHERLGRVYEQMGKPTKAAAAYERFVAAWEDADPALQPRVDTARQRLRAIRSETTSGRRAQ